MNMKASGIFLLIFLVAGGGFLFSKGNQEAQEQEEITPIVWYVPGGPYTNSEPVYEALNEMLEKDLSISLDLKPNGGFGEYRETMPLAMAAGEYFDIVWTANWCNNFLDGATAGLYAGLDELLPEHAPTIWKDTADSLEAARVNGEIRGVWSQQIAAYTTNIVLHQSHIDKYGWDISSIKSLEDLEPLLADIKANEPDLPAISARYPLPFWQLTYLGYTDPGVLREVLAVRIDDDDVKVFNLLEDPEYIEMIRLMRSWFEKGYFENDGLTITNDQWVQMERNGQVAMFMHNTWIPGQDVQTTGYGDTTIRVPYGDSLQTTSNIVSTLNAIGTESKYQEKAVQMLEYFWTNPDAYNTLVWGLEGTHYEMLEGGFFKPNEDSGYFTNIPWVFGNTFLSLQREGGNLESPKLVADLNKRATKATIMGFVPDLESLQTLTAEVSTVVAQYDLGVQNGYLDTDEYLPQYQAALKQAGIDELIAELQSQIDAWKAAK